MTEGHGDLQDPDKPPPQFFQSDTFCSPPGLNFQENDLPTSLILDPGTLPFAFCSHHLRGTGHPQPMHITTQETTICDKPSSRCSEAFSSSSSVSLCKRLSYGVNFVTLVPAVMSTIHTRNGWAVFPQTNRAFSSWTFETSFTYCSSFDSRVASSNHSSATPRRFASAAFTPSR